MTTISAHHARVRTTAFERDAAARGIRCSTASSPSASNAAAARAPPR